MSFHKVSTRELCTFPYTAIKKRFLLGLVLCSSLTACAGGPRPITFEDRERIRSTAVQFPALDLTAPHDGRAPVVLAATFDGTRNDRLQVGPRNLPTIIAFIHDEINRSGSLARPAAYYAGVGTSGSQVHRLFDAATGRGANAIAEHACREMIANMRAIRLENPNVDIRVFVSGFSRGAATARHFMNLMERGCERSASPRDLGEFRTYAVLFDTVATGQHRNLDLQIPATADQVIHFVSRDERRIFFKPVLDEFRGLGASADRVHTVLLPGVHSDGGVAYEKGVGNAYRVLVRQLIYQMGLSGVAEAELLSDASMEGGNDSRWLLERVSGVSPARSADDQGRSGMFIRPAALSQERWTEWVSRRSSLLSQRGPFSSRLQAYTLPVFDVAWEGGSASVITVSSAYVDDFSRSAFQRPEIAFDGEAAELRYWLMGTKMTRLPLPRPVVSQIRRIGKSRLELGMVSRGETTRLWWIVNGRVLAPLSQ